MRIYPLYGSLPDRVSSEGSRVTRRCVIAYTWSAVLEISSRSTRQVFNGWKLGAQRGFRVGDERWLLVVTFCSLDGIPGVVARFCG